jgi:hypothetical protein
MKMGKLFETSFHHINGKHGRPGHGGHTVSRKFLVMEFLVKPILSEFAPDRGKHVQSNRGRIKHKYLNAVV